MMNRYDPSWPAKNEWEVGPRMHPFKYLDGHWNDYLVGPDMSVMESGLEPDDADWVYFLWHRGGWLLYVGSTNSPKVRFKAHRRRGVDFSQFGRISVRDEIRSEVEKAYIDALAPPLNRMYAQSGWSGRQPMLDAIKELWS